MYTIPAVAILRSSPFECNYIGNIIVVIDRKIHNAKRFFLLINNNGAYQYDLLKKHYKFFFFRKLYLVKIRRPHLKVRNVGKPTLERGCRTPFIV